MNSWGEVLESIRRKVQEEMNGIYDHTGLHMWTFSMKKNFNLETPGAGLVSGAGALLVTLVVCCMEANSHWEFQNKNTSGQMSACVYCQIYSDIVNYVNQLIHRSLNLVLQVLNNWFDYCWILWMWTWASNLCIPFSY